MEKVDTLCKADDSRVLQHNSNHDSCLCQMDLDLQQPWLAQTKRAESEFQERYSAGKQAEESKQIKK